MPNTAHQLGCTHTCCFASQFVREFAKLGLTRSVGGVLGLALTRELTPVITSIILAGLLQKPSSLANGRLDTPVYLQHDSSLMVTKLKWVLSNTSPATLASQTTGRHLSGKLHGLDCYQPSLWTV